LSPLHTIVVKNVSKHITTVTVYDRLKALNIDLRSILRVTGRQRLIYLAAASDNVEVM